MTDILLGILVMLVRMAVVLAVVFGIGLVLMRTWHRIDPS